MALHIIQTAMTTEALSQILASVSSLDAEQGDSQSDTKDIQRDVIMLTNSACLMANHGSASAKLLREYRVYCLNDHAVLLGVILDSAVQPCDMTDFVALSAAHRQSISW